MVVSDLISVYAAYQRNNCP